MKCALVIAFCIVALASIDALAQGYPSRAVRLVVPYAPGGDTDFTARAITPKLSEALGQQVVVENRPGGGTNIGSDLVAKAAPDGYTLLMGGAANAINMSLYDKLPYDTQRDFAPVSLCVKGANVLLMHPSLPAKTLKELIALARAQPGQLNYAIVRARQLQSHGGRAAEAHGRRQHHARAVQGQRAGAHRHYRRPRRNADQRRAGAAAARPAADACARSRSAASSAFPALPDMPTVDESGLKGFEATTWFGVMAPAKTPREIVARLNLEIGRILAAADVRERFITNEGVEPIGGTPEQFAAFIREEIDKYAKVVKAAKLKAE